MRNPLPNLQKVEMRLCDVKPPRVREQMVRNNMQTLVQGGIGEGTCLYRGYVNVHLSSSCSGFGVWVLYFLRWSTYVKSKMSPK